MTATDGRVVIHLDLDAFYAQVETVRLGLNPSTPVAVQQWHGIIAVNYPARAFNVKRHNTVEEAKKLCPEMVFVHVETIGEEEGEGDGGDDGDDDEDADLTTAGPSSSRYVPRDEPNKSGEANIIKPPDRESQKVSLARYRRASWAVMNALDDAFPNSPVERASVDEVYIDVTGEVDKLLLDEENASSLESVASVDSLITSALSTSGTVRRLTPNVNVSDRRLGIGAHFCSLARAAVFKATKYTMSGGVAHNKMLAKLASAKNKPNKQTVVSRVAVSEMLQGLPMRSVKGLGGKLGEKVELALVERFKSVSAESGQNALVVQKSGTGTGSSHEGGFTVDKLAMLFEEDTEGVSGMGSGTGIHTGLDEKTITWLKRVSNGEDLDPVTGNVRVGVKSVTAFKSFKVLHAKEGVHKWLKVLSHELAERLLEDKERLNRVPRGVRMEYRAEQNPNCHPPRLTFETKSKAFKFPFESTNALSKGDVHTAGEFLTQTAIHVFEQIGAAHTLPSTRVGLAACDFVAAPAQGGGIEMFFKTGVPTVPTSGVQSMPTVPPPAFQPKPTKPKGGLDGFFKPKKEIESEKEKDAEEIDSAVRLILEENGNAETSGHTETETEHVQDLPSTSKVTCPRCGLITEAGSETQSHLDEHMAYDLSKEAPQHFRPPQKAVTDPRAKKRLKKTSGGKKNESGGENIKSLFARKG